MKRGAFVLLFQAIATLIMGVVFLLSFLTLDNMSLDNIKKSFTTSKEITKGDVSTSVEKIKQRYIIAAYILLIISVIELLLITRLRE